MDAGLKEAGCVVCDATESKRLAEEIDAPFNTRLDIAKNAVIKHDPQVHAARDLTLQSMEAMRSHLVGHTNGTLVVADDTSLQAVGEFEVSAEDATNVSSTAEFAAEMATVLQKEVGAERDNSVAAVCATHVAVKLPKMVKRRLAKTKANSAQ